MFGGLRSWLYDPTSAELMSIDSDRALKVNQKTQKTIIFSEYLKTSADVSNMAITTGTLANPVEYYISADPVYDILITELNFAIAGAGSALNEFGTGTALTNGCRMYYTDDAIGEIQINPIVRTNYDLVRFASGRPSFGTGADAFRLTNAISTDEVFWAVVSLQEKMPLGKGIRLEKGTNQRLVMQIRDNTLTTKASRFDCIVSGEKIP